MPVHRPGFSERVFEFGFNAEFAHRQRAVLAAAPHIPTQNEEKTLGYDVKFEIDTHGGAKNYLALQHKVARFVDGSGGSNGKFRAAAGGNYYAFRIDVDQYNLIERVASSSIPGLEFYYCAPVFTTTKAMNALYMGNLIERNSLWIDVRGTGPLSFHESHTMVYGATGASAFVFSDHPTPLKVLRPAERNAATAETDGAAPERDPRAVYAKLFDVVASYWPHRARERAMPSEDGSTLRMPSRPPQWREVKDAGAAVEAIGELVSDYIGGTLLVEVRK